jgi:hypothetical protein
MTPADVRTLIDHAPMPPGFELVVEPLRKFQYRNLWTVRVLYEGDRIFGRSAYPSSLPAAIRACQKVAWQTAGSGE